MFHVEHWNGLQDSWGYARTSPPATMEAQPEVPRGSACGPVIVPVFKTGGRQVFLSPVGSTPTRFRHSIQPHPLARLEQGQLLYLV